MSIGEIVPQIWADTLLASLKKRMIIGAQWSKEEQARHEQRILEDPEYARAYELRRAEEEAESYWDALYRNRLPEEDEDEW